MKFLITGECYFREVEGQLKGKNIFGKLVEQADYLTHDVPIPSCYDIVAVLGTTCIQQTGVPRQLFH